jgi:glycosyltransferase involved in cell wall biosynthesis
MQQPSELHKIAFIGDYLPRKCGIATFTHDVRGAVAGVYPDLQCFVVPVNDVAEGYEYPSEVRFEIREQDIESYQQAADFLNISNVDLVCVQHEFGIFGGPAGSHLLALLRELKVPVVTTLHTILQRPDPAQRRVMEELIQLSTRVVVMTQLSQKLLSDVYKAPASKIDLIPHGIPDTPFVDPNFYKDQFGVEGKQVILTFGLLSPNKGIEYMLNALPTILKEFPDVAYIILGATHPHLIRNEGEKYRLSLESLAKKLKVQKNVIFYDRFVELSELKEFIGACDLYVTPYLTEAQIVSGTLSYAFGNGKVVVSTPYWHASELLANDRGVLVPFRDSQALGDSILSLLRDEPRRNSIRKNAYIMGREMVWSNVGHLYVKSFEQARLDRAAVTRKIFATKTLDQQVSHLPDIKLDHLIRMSDSTGLLQHAKFSVPHYGEGYCTDDNARALILTVLLEELGDESSTLQALAYRYLAFLNHAFDRENQLFRNFLSFARTWTEKAGSEDSQGRALWALGVCVGRSKNTCFHTLAGGLFEQSLPSSQKFTSPRACAFALIGIHEYLERLPGDRLVNQVRDMLTTRLLEHFKANRQNDWIWFEQSLTYENAKIPHALILSGRKGGLKEVLDVGLESLKWLMQIQSAPAGYFRPIGSNGFFTRGGTPAGYDQQPIEAHATVSACLEAFRATNENSWFEQARNTFEWYLGRNDLGLELYDPTTGGCCDALHVDRVNRNEGAESTLAFLLSVAELQQMQNVISAFSKPWL